MHGDYVVKYAHLYTNQLASGSSSSSADPYSALMNQMTAISLRHSEDTVKIFANQEEFRNTLAYVC